MSALASLPSARFVERRPHYDLWAVPSVSHPQEPHRVLVYHDGKACCPCPRFTLGQQRCRHIEAVMTAIGGTVADKFDPKKHMTILQGKEYLEVKWRLVWFRQDHPTATIETDILAHDPEGQWAVVKAVIRTDDGALAHGTVLQRPTGIAKDYIANGETSAIGRALAALGYGTQFAPELDQGDQVVDSPVDSPANQQKAPKAQRPAPPEPPKPDADPLTQARKRLHTAAGLVEWTPEHVASELVRRTKAARPQWTAADYNALAMDLEAVARGEADLTYDADGRPVFQRGPVAV